MGIKGGLQLVLRKRSLKDHSGTSNKKVHHPHFLDTALADGRPQALDSFPEGIVAQIEPCETWQARNHCRKVRYGVSLQVVPAKVEGLARMMEDVIGTGE